MSEITRQDSRPHPNGGHPTVERPAGDLRRQDLRPVGEIVREIAKATEQEVQRAAQVAEAAGCKLGEVLVNSEVITPEDKQRSLGRQWGVPSELLVYEDRPYKSKDMLAYTILHGYLDQRGGTRKQKA